jgi:hypothetical protein
MKVREPVMTCPGLVSQIEGKRTGFDLLKCGFKRFKRTVMTCSDVVS